MRLSFIAAAVLQQMGRAANPFPNQPERQSMSNDIDNAEPFRELDDHKVNPANDRITIQVVDEPGSGGANHLYQVLGYEAADTNANGVLIQFQNGPIAEAGVNGLTHEVLLAIVADRLRSFQKGRFATRYNALALTHIEEAQNWLNRRTLERMRRGVEGTHKV